MPGNQEDVALSEWLVAQDRKAHGSIYGLLQWANQSLPNAVDGETRHDRHPVRSLRPAPLLHRGGGDTGTYIAAMPEIVKRAMALKLTLPSSSL